MLWRGSKYAVLCGSLLLAACGGGSSSSPSAPATSVVVAVPTPGPWSGTYTLGSAAAVSAQGAIAENGFGYFADTGGNVFIFGGLPKASPFTSVVTAYAAPGQTFANGQSVVGFFATGSYSSGSSGISLQADITENDGNGNLAGSLTFASATPFSGSSSVAGLQGSWSGFYLGKAGTSLSLTIAANGTLSGNDGYGCSLSGSLVQVAPGLNLYYVNFASSGSGCAGVLGGLAYQSTTDVSGAFGNAQGTYLYMGVFGSRTAYYGELKL